MAVSCAFMFFAAFLIITLRLFVFSSSSSLPSSSHSRSLSYSILLWENKRRDKAFGYVDPMKAYKAPYGSKGAADAEEGSVLSEQGVAKDGSTGVEKGEGDGVNKEWRFIL
jgi:hypothetical protein